MNKTELIDAIAKEAGLSKKDAAAALNAFTETVTPKFKAGKALKDLVNKK